MSKISLNNLKIMMKTVLISKFTPSCKKDVTFHLHLKLNLSDPVKNKK